VQPAGVTFSTIDAGLTQTCGVTAQGTGYCWGQIINGSFGNGTFSGNSLTPVEAATSSGPWLSIQVGGEFACGINTSGRVFCWGSTGRLGNGSLGSSAVPVEVLLPAGQRFVSVATGGIAACALSDADELFCWGFNNNGSVGDGTTIDRLSPVRIE
jgi:alpha-tubulin suppressor-like RCC1 family protein